MDTKTYLTPHLEWQAPSQVTHERSHRWYAVAGVAAASAIVYGVITGAWTLSVVVALVGGIFYLIRNHEHRTHTIRILPLGIEFDGVLRPWHRWKNFWILVGPGYNELHIAAGGLHSDLIIQTGSMDPYVVRDTLLHFLPQHPKPREKLLDAISRFCKL